jgi:hypothetical protein
VSRVCDLVELLGENKDRERLAGVLSLCRVDCGMVTLTSCLQSAGQTGWLGLSLSTSPLTHCVYEAGRAVEPLKESWIEEVKPTALVHGDETGWKERAEAREVECFISVHTGLSLGGDAPATLSPSRGLNGYDQERPLIFFEGHDLKAYRSAPTRDWTERSTVFCTKAPNKALPTSSPI